MKNEQTQENMTIKKRKTFLVYKSEFHLLQQFWKTFFISILKEMLFERF